VQVAVRKRVGYGAKVPPDPTPEEIFEVFSEWVSVCRSSALGRKPVLGDKRRRKIKQAIGLYGLESCKTAIRGITCSPWHMGHNPQGKRYDDIELILRDERHIEMFLDMADQSEKELSILEQYANGTENPF
jgi:hypothetical protein